jgi:hypothetical protein
MTQISQIFLGEHGSGFGNRQDAKNAKDNYGIVTVTYSDM